MKLRNAEVDTGDTLVITSPFIANHDGNEQEFLLGTRVTLEKIEDTRVYFSHSAKSYHGDYSYFATLEQWFNLQNQFKYLEDAPAKPKQVKAYALKLDRSLDFIFRFVFPVLFFAGFIFLLWLLSGLFAKP